MMKNEHPYEPAPQKPKERTFEAECDQASQKRRQSKTEYHPQREQSIDDNQGWVRREVFDLAKLNFCRRPEEPSHVCVDKSSDNT
jgi:hypothetical protein